MASAGVPSSTTSPRRLDRRHGGRVRHQRSEVRPASGSRLFEHDADRVTDREALRLELPRRLVSDVPFDVHAYRDLHHSSFSLLWYELWYDFHN